MQKCWKEDLISSQLTETILLTPFRGPYIKGSGRKFYLKMKGIAIKYIIHFLEQFC